MTRITRRARTRAPWIIVALLGLAGPAVFADAGWFESGDTQLRMDLQLLNDAQVIRLPLNQWPLPRAAVRYALEVSKEPAVPGAGVTAALARVRARVDMNPGGESNASGGHGGVAH